MQHWPGGRSVTAVVREFQPLGEQVLGDGKSRKWEFVVDEKNGVDIYYELFVCGNRVVVSNGIDREARTVKATYTVESDIVQAFPCQFADPDGTDSTNGTFPALYSESGKATVPSGLCIVEEAFLHFYSSSGDCFNVPLAFQVGCAFPLKDGIIIQEKRRNPTVTPQVYCLFHPADVLAPVTFNLPGISDDCLELVWACPDPALAVFMNIQTRIHSIWSLKTLEPTGMLQMVTSDIAAFRSMANIRSTSHTPFFGSDLGKLSRQSSRGSLHRNPVYGQPASPFSTGKTPESGRLAPQTHVWSGGSGQNIMRSESLATVLQHRHSRSRNQALSHEIPRPLSQHLGRTDYRTLPRCAPVTFSPHFAGVKKRVSSVTGVDRDVSISENSFLEGIAAMSPAMELNRLWIDKIVEGDLNEGDSSKAFLYRDFSAKCFICILTSGRLKLVEYGQTSDPTTILSHCLRCKDALPLMGLGVLLLLCEGNQLSLYCGEQEVCQVAFDYGCGVGHLVSSVRSNAYLEMNSGQAVQLILPALPTCIPVETCLKALQCVLPCHVYNTLHSLWYVRAVETSKKTNIAGNKLLDIFSAFVLEACGVSEVNMDTTESLVTVNKDEAWQNLLADLEKPGTRTNNTAFLAGLPRIDIEAASLTAETKQLRVEAFSLLHGHLAVVFFSLHLVHEEMKLNGLLHGSLSVLAQLLVTLGICLSCQSYVDYYYSSYPTIHRRMALSSEQDSCLVPEIMEEYLSNPYDIMVWLQNAFESDQNPFPILNGVTRRTQDICIAFSMFSWLCGVRRDSSRILKPFGLSGDDQIRSATALYEKLGKDSSAMNAVVQFVAVQGYSPEVLQSFPVGVAIPIQEALHHCCNDPPTDWPIEAYRLLGRDDLAKQKDVAVGKNPRLEPKPTIRPSRLNSKESVSDGMDHLIEDEILRMRFSQDHRIREVRRLLQSAKPCRINLRQRPEISDHEFIEEQEQWLFVICQRTMALPVARGMFTLGTLRPIITEPLPVPPLTLKGQAPPRNSAVNLDHIDTPTGMTDWPEFHNGVACGLVIDPRMKEVNSSWITYNQPADKQLANEHAGFLLALGLTGHLKNLGTHRIHSYLSNGHELTSTGLLLGLSAAKRGTSDIELTRMLSVHIQALLPLGSAELDIPPLVQTAAVVGVGLVYEGSAHRHMVDVLLGEIGRPAGPELENATDRESYALASGLALGMVALGKADNVVGLSDLKIADTLFSYMTAGQLKGPVKPVKKEAIHSYRILETGAVNAHVTAPGAILALGLIYMKSNNSAVAQWLETPDSHFALQSIRPDFLTLRTISHGLILWDAVYPSEQWVESQIPQNISSLAFQSSKIDDDASIVDYKLISQAKVHITAGACMAIGLKFAGTSNQCAFDCLVKYCKDFIALSESSMADEASRHSVEYCLHCCLLALSMVMAGTGNLTVLQLTRQLHGGLRGIKINYGSHMAVHMALGFLFLGGARYSLMGSDRSIPSLLCSVFPMFPNYTTDNRYHLQALRHLYVLACEPRLVIPRDVHTLELCYVPAEIDLLNETESVTISVLLPCLLPPLGSVKEVRVRGDRYWPVRIQVEGNEECTRTLLGAGGTLLVQKRQGYLSYKEDPKGHSAILSQWNEENSTDSESFTGLGLLDTQASVSLGMALSTLSLKLGRLTVDHLTASSNASPHAIPVSRPSDGSKQIQTGKEVELVLRFYSSVPGLDYKRACRANLMSPLVGNIAMNFVKKVKV